LRDQSKINVQPARIELVKLNRQMTLEQFNSQYPSTIPVQELAIINEVEDPATPLQAGRTVKRVVGGLRSSGS
jgi:predicted Zn-dependent protease